MRQRDVFYVNNAYQSNVLARVYTETKTQLGTQDCDKVND